jgi:hypothetical protein
VSQYVSKALFGFANNMKIALILSMRKIDTVKIKRVSQSFANRIKRNNPS